MISFIIRICIVALLAIVGYNYFFGNAAEKAQSREVVQKARSLVGAGADLLRAEKARYREGKYDGVIEKLDAAYRSIRRGASHLDARVLEELETLEARKLKLRAAIDTLDSARVHSKDNRPPGNAEEASRERALGEQQRQLQAELERLFQDSQQLLETAENQ
jgi:hypothetical protein